MLQTRKDLLQAHRLMARRAGLALLQAEPDPPDQPLRRLNIGMFSSLLVAVIVVAVFGIWGFLTHGHALGLTARGSLLIDKATGTPFVPCQHGKLCPVVNYASARLALNTASPNQRGVTQASLDRYPHGPEIGIAGLPEPLPQPGMLTGQPWSVCVQTKFNAVVQKSHVVTTLVGGEHVGGRPMSASAAAVVMSGRNDWLIWNGERLLIPVHQRNVVLTALGAGGAAPQAVPAGWLDSLTQGPHFAPPAVPGFGKTTTLPHGGTAHVGQVFVNSTASGRRYYVTTEHGLVPVTETDAKLLETEPNAKPHGVLAPAQAVNLRGHAGAGGLPLTLPRLMANSGPGAPLCEVYSGASAAHVTVGGQVPAGLAIAGNSLVSQIAMKPGTGALVAETNGPQPDVTSYFMVTNGTRYALASPGVAAVLGYNLRQQQVQVPARVIDLIPQGPALDPTAARNRIAG